MIPQDGVYIVEQIIELAPPCLLDKILERELHPGYTEFVEGVLVEYSLEKAKKEKKEQEDQENPKGQTFPLDSKGKPIIKLSFCKNPEIYEIDGKRKKIADFEIIYKGALSFKRYEGLHIQGNFEITDLGYDILKNFLDKNNTQSEEVRIYTQDYHCLLKKGFFTLQAHIDDIVTNMRFIKGSVQKQKMTVKKTTQKFNTDIYNRLLEIYSLFSDPFFGNK